MAGYQAGIRSYENAVNPIDEQVSPWESLTQEQLDDIKRECLNDLNNGGEAKLFGVTIGWDSHSKVCDVVDEADAIIGDDWLTECLEPPYSEKHGEYKQKLWDAFCDAVDEELSK